MVTQLKVKLATRAAAADQGPRVTEVCICREEHLLPSCYESVKKLVEVTCAADGRYGITGNVTRGSMQRWVWQASSMAVALNLTLILTLTLTVTLALAYANNTHLLYPAVHAIPALYRPPHPGTLS